MATKHNTAIRMPKREGYPSRKPARSPPFCFFSCRPLPCCTGERPTALLSCGWPAEESVEEADELEQLKLDEGRSPGPRFDRAVVISWLMPRVPSARRRNRTMKRRLSIERVHILARRAAWCCALRAALRLRLAFGSADAGAAAAAGLLGAAVAPPPAVDLLGGCDCNWEKERPRRRAVAKAFLSVERCRSSANSLRAAKRALSSTLHAARGDRRASEGGHSKCVALLRFFHK